MVQDALNVYAVFRYALGYPDGQRHHALASMSGDTPSSLEELEAIYIGLFEAGLPRPKCPLLESHYVKSRSAPQVVLENKLFYRHFGLDPHSRAAPDHLLTQLEFLSWLDHCEAEGNPGAEAIRQAREDFLERHVRHWLPRAAALAESAGGGCYAALLDSLARTVSAEAGQSPLRRAPEHNRL